MGARLVKVSDFRKVQVPVEMWPPPDEVPPHPDPLPRVGEGNLAAEFYLGQISAVLSLARTNQLKLREALTNIEQIVHNYEGTDHE